MERGNWHGTTDLPCTVILNFTAVLFGGYTQSKNSKSKGAAFAPPIILHLFVYYLVCITRQNLGLPTTSYIIESP